MNCQEAIELLLAEETPAAPSAAVRRHLAACPRCQVQRQRLLTLERGLADLPRPGESPHARQQLVERLPARPTTIIVPARPAFRHARRGLALAAAAACLFAVVAWTQWPTPNPSVATPTPLATMRTLVADEGLIPAMVESDLRLAQLTTRPEQAETLADMAERLQAEAIRVARQGSAEELAWLRNMHGQVVGGLAGRARNLEPDEREKMAQSLRRRADEADSAASQLGSARAAHLQAISAVSRHAEAALRGNPWVAPSPRGDTPPPSQRLLNALVLNGVRLAGEDDPLRRADCCTDIADRLLQSIREASAAGDAEAAASLSQHLGAVMDRGVAANLDLAEEGNAPEEEVERVRGRASQAHAALQRVLENAPAPARPGILKALEAMPKGLEKSKGKGKGPPPGKGRDFIPPGLKKGKGQGPFDN